MDGRELPGARTSRHDRGETMRRQENYEKGARNSRKGSFRGRRPSRKRGRPTRKACRRSLEPCFPYISGEEQPGESSGYASGSGISVSGDEMGERALCPRILTLPPIACSPTLETRTRTASPLTPTSPLSPAKLTPVHSGRSTRRQRPSLLSLSTSTASSGDSAVVLDFSAVSSQTSMKSGDQGDGESPATSARRSHLEPPAIGRPQRRQRNRNPSKLTPLDVSGPNVSPKLPRSNLYLSDTYSNLTKKELYYRFQPPAVSDSSHLKGINQPMSLSTSPSLTRQVLPPVGHSPVGHPVRRQREVIGTQQGQGLTVHRQPVPVIGPPHTQSSHASWHKNSKMSSRSASQSTEGRFEILRDSSTTRNPNLRVVGGQPISMSLDSGIHRVPLPSIGTSLQLLASSSNLCLCRSHQGIVEIRVPDGQGQTAEEQESRSEATDSHAPLPLITKRCYGTTSSSESSTPNSSLLDLARLADGTIPQINLIAPTPCPVTPLPPQPNYQT